MIASTFYAGLWHEPGWFRRVDAADLPVAVCGILGRQLQEVPDTAVLRSAIAARLRQTLQPQWIRTTDIAIVALAFDGLHACASRHINGDIMAAFALRLVDLEVAVGGPYRRSEHDEEADAFTNACIAQCLSWMAAPLPNVSQCVRSVIADIDEVETADWALYAALHQAAEKPHSQQAAVNDVLSHLELIRASACAQILYRSAEGGTDSAAAGVVAQRVHRLCLGRLPAFTEPFDTNTRTMLERVISVDTNHEISQLAWYYGQALGVTDAGQLARPRAVDARTYIQLGTANVYAWAAYTIYDDFLDDEGQPTMLGTANYTFRAMVRHYRYALPDNVPFQHFVEQVLTTVDQANTLETTHFRLPITGRTLHIGQLPDFAGRELLADRALFHIIGPMAVLASGGRAVIGDEAWHHTLQALRHYLIARQLNDDVHDWAKDLQAGQATYVVVELLRELKLPAGGYDLDGLLPQARQKFWQDVLPRICDVALEHVVAARQHLGQGPPLSRRNDFMSLFDYVEDSMRDARRKRDQGRALLRTLRRSS